MSGYHTFAWVYDTLMGRVDYEKRGDYLLSVFEKYGQDPPCLLDLGCGTGRMTRLLANKGKEMVGVDGSPEMLAKAREETPADVDILWVCQDLRELDLYGTAQGAISTFDTLNHITGQGELKDFFGRLRYFLEPGNLFVFDVNTPYKHENILGNHTFVYDTHDVYCVWQNQTQERLTKISLDLFIPQNGAYTRTTETFEERGYTLEELQKAASPWFEPVDVFEDLTFDPPREDGQRMICVMKKV